MPSRLLTLLLVPVLAVAAAACGSDNARSADSSTDTSQLLHDTFANLGKMKSADMNLQLHLTSPQGAVGAHGDEAGFEGLAEDFQDGAREFGEFIEEEDAVMGEGDFAGARDFAAADDGGAGGGVMW
jgi:hypothetical protein